MQVEKIETGYRWQSAILFGEFREIMQTGEKLRILHEFNERFARLTPVEALSGTNRKPGDAVVFSIAVERVTGAAES